MNRVKKFYSRICYYTAYVIYTSLSMYIFSVISDEILYISIKRCEHISNRNPNYRPTNNASFMY